MMYDYYYYYDDLKKYVCDLLLDIEFVRYSSDDKRSYDEVSSYKLDCKFVVEFQEVLRLGNLFCVLFILE